MYACLDVRGRSARPPQAGGLAYANFLLNIFQNTYEYNTIWGKIKGKGYFYGWQHGCLEIPSRD